MPVTFHYRHGEHHLRYRRRTIEDDGLNEYQRINYAPPFQVLAKHCRDARAHPAPAVTLLWRYVPACNRSRHAHGRVRWR